MKQLYVYYEYLLKMLYTFSVLTMAEFRCGRLDEKLLYTTNEQAEPSENPWVGILLEDQGQLTLEVLTMKSPLLKPQVNN